MKKNWTIQFSGVFAMILFFGTASLQAQIVGGGAQNDEFLVELVGAGGLTLTFDQASPCQILGPTWGGDVLTTITGDVVWGYDGPGGATVDSFLCDTVLNDYTGKILVVRRGTCAISNKTYWAQKAGAIAVIVLNNVANPNDCVLPNPGAGPTAAQVTIPTVNTAQVAANQIRSLLNAGPVSGSFLVAPFGPRDIKQVNPFYTPLSVQTPLTQIYSDTFGFATSVLNTGTETATNVKVVAQVQTEAGAVLYSDTVTILSIAVGDTVRTTDASNDVVGNFGLFVPTQANGIVVGNYNIVYNITTDGNDARPTDNNSTARFIVTETLFAKEIDIVQASRPGTLPDKWSWGNVYTMSPATFDTFEARSIVFTYACNAAPDPQPNEIAASLTLFRFNDDILSDFSNFNPTMFPPESGATFAGFGIFQAPTDAVNYQLHSVPLLDFNTGNDFVPLDPGARYLATVTYEKPYNTVFQAYGNEATLPGVSDLLYLTAWSGGFIGDPDPLIRLNIYLSTTTDNKVLPSNSMRIMPNPVFDNLTLQFDFEQNTPATITLAALDGRVITIDDRPSGVQNDQLQYSVAHLAAGTYIARVATAEGTLTKKFVVVK
ncbi:MAG: PA domain-containing protein [Saprospiraceae bacterium]